ncbi:MAG: flavodoxin family protein [bacterium]
MFVIISSSPNANGLTASCVEAVKVGIHEAGQHAEHIDLSKMSLERCRQCGNGWGQCRTENTCVIPDDLGELQRMLAIADGVIMITPVYYGEMSDSMKCACDRIRRCQAPRSDHSILKNKPIIAIAAAGGSGNGTLSCLTLMERFIQQGHAHVQDLVAITRRNRSYKLDTIRIAAREMVSTAS